MALFDGVSTLEDVLGRQADTATMGISDAYAKKRRREVARQASSGRLRSGVANYSLADVDSGEIGDIGEVGSSLEEALGGVPVEDYFSEQDYNRQVELAKLIGRMNKKSKLSGILGGIGGSASTGAALGGPWGALAGGVAGGVMGGYA